MEIDFYLNFRFLIFSGSEIFVFIDEAVIHVSGGDGGNGAVAFRREKYVPYGGPAGGDGGRGGNIYLVIDKNLNTLFMFKYKSYFKAQRGLPGGGNRKTGKSGEDLIVKVPPGTVIKDFDTGHILYDLTDPYQRLLVARGGRGGRGNARFPTSTHQSPRRAEKGESGEERSFKLELKLLADVGIIGYPNVGKSTFISRISAAKPKIADYPFTTLIPNLGVVTLTDSRTAVFADIPGLIEGSHKGVGLGYQFLRHIERTKILLHMISLSDIDATSPLANYDTINKELNLYNPGLSELPQIVVGNKIDLPEGKEIKDRVAEDCRNSGVPFYPISAVTGEGLTSLLNAVKEFIQKYDYVSEEDGPGDLQTILLPRKTIKNLHIEKIDNRYIVKGDIIEKKVLMTYLDNEECLNHLQRYLYRYGIIETLEKEGIQDGDIVAIADFEFSYFKDRIQDGEIRGSNKWI